MDFWEWAGKKLNVNCFPSMQLWLFVSKLFYANWLGQVNCLFFFINVCQFVYMRFWEWGGKANSFFIPVCLLLGFLVMYHLYFRSIVFPFRAGPLGFVACPHSHTQTSYKYTLINANEVHIHPLISQVWILLNGGLRFWTKKLVHVPARPDFITDDCWTYSNSVVRNQHWWSALQLVSDRSISPFRTRAGTFLKLVWKWSFWWSQTCVNWLALLYHILFNANSCLDNIQWYLHDALLQMLDLLVRHTHTLVLCWCSL